VDNSLRQPGDVVLEESQLHHYWEIDDAADPVPASAERLSSADSSDVEPKTPYDHLDDVPRRDTLPPPVYLQLVTDDGSVVEHDVATAAQTQATVPGSQALSTDPQPDPDIAQ